ncbi:MAG TPA: HEPN domain-containing protein [Sumerlaeia bacterium]|nr:HEPN domain-containing protein [Sumerlaeia bacterium]
MPQPDENLLAVVKQWLDRGEEDLGVAKELTEGGKPYFSAIGFHCQQAAEKFLKALLTYRQVRFPRTHDIARLLDLVATVDEDLAGTLADCVELTPFAVETRYPATASEVTWGDIRALLALAEEARTGTRSRITGLPRETG